MLDIASDILLHYFSLAQSLTLLSPDTILFRIPEVKISAMAFVFLVYAIPRSFSELSHAVRESKQSPEYPVVITGVYFPC